MGKRNPILIKLLDDTKKDIDHFLNRYAEKVISGDASLFLGSGVSRESGFPSWAALLAPCAEELGIDMGDDTDLYSIAQYYSNRHSDAELRQLFNKAINQFAEPGDVLNNLLEIPFRSIWTTNYDRLIEHGLDKQNIGYNSIVNDMDLASISRDTKISVYKMNGDISEPTKMIVTKNDYEHYSQKHPLFLTFLKKELVANTFLFVGYSFSDALVLDCLSSLTEYLGTAGGCHYAIMLVNERVTAKTQYFFEDLRKRYNIKCLAVRKEDIPSLISRLSLKVREKRCLSQEPLIPFLRRSILLQTAFHMSWFNISMRTGFVLLLVLENAWELSSQVMPINIWLNVILLTRLDICQCARSHSTWL